jgi:hypothetical protein
LPNLLVQIANKMGLQNWGGGETPWRHSLILPSLVTMDLENNPLHNTHMYICKPRSVDVTQQNSIVNLKFIVFAMLHIILWSMIGRILLTTTCVSHNTATCRNTYSLSKRYIYIYIYMGCIYVWGGPGFDPCTATYKIYCALWDFFI